MHSFRTSLAVLLVSLSPVHAEIKGPYAIDASTVHLFHFNESAGASVATNSTGGGPSALAFDGNPTANHATNAQASVTTVLGATGYAGFGNAANVSDADFGLGLDTNASGGFQMGLDGGASPDAFTHSLLAGADGSFTLEALVKLSSITGLSREMICTDSSTASRGFQFRVNTDGQLEFNFIGTNAATSTVAIPLTGTHAFVANEWFHTALVFNGPTSTSTFYWTRVSASSTAANVIGTSTAETTSGSISSPLVIGNEARSNGASSEGLRGVIDEVRISRVARAASEFIFEPPVLDPDADPDGDGYVNSVEQAAGSDPNNINSIPGNIDADTLPDAWEQTYFGSLSQTGTGDPDGDTETNSTELANSTAPNHRASHSTDTDADALPDAWEQQYFGNITYNGGSDPDGDDFGNLQELLASTHPASAASRPAGTAAKLVPLDDGNNATSDFGYAGSSAINSVAFVRSSIKTVGNQQFITWYGRHQYDSAALYNNTIWIGRRTLGSSQWEIFRHPSFTANAITDGHDVISYGIDGDGYMHVSWGMHGDAFHYSKSTTPVTGTGPITLGPDTTMTGQEAIVTYPQFLKLPNGDLLFVFRRNYSGNGTTYVTRYTIADKTWRSIHQNNGVQAPFISGMWAPAYDYNAYVNMPQLGGPDGDDLILTFCWRYLPVNGSGAPGSPGNFGGYQTNNNLNFARSPDAGVTWQKFDGTAYTLPITRDLEISEANKAEIIVPIPEGSSLINQASTCLDANDNPVTCTWWAPQTSSLNYRRQYMVVFRDDNGTVETTDDTWQTRAVSNRASDPTGTRYAEDHVRDLGRPIVVTDDEDRIIVIYRDNQSSTSLTTGVDNGLTIVHSLPKSQDPHRLVWIQFNLTTENLGNYEPIIDNELWDRDRQLHLLYQPAGGQGYTPPTNTASRFSVLEWDALSYFAHRIQPSIAFRENGTQIDISCQSEPSWSYRLWSSPNLEDWSPVETRPGTGQPLVFTYPANAGETKKYWRVESKEGGFE